jgi:hypothetical protein
MRIWWGVVDMHIIPVKTSFSVIPADKSSSVIPAKAGIQVLENLDPRLRGDDGGGGGAFAGMMTRIRPPGHPPAQTTGNAAVPR